MKILVIAMAGVGDAILATPLIRELRANFPDAQLDALVLWDASRDALEGNPCLNTIYQRNLIRTGKLEALRFLLPLRRVRYDVSINAHPQSRIHYRLIARIIGARTRISHRYECSGLLDRWLVNRELAQDYQQHSVENNLRLLPLLGKQPTQPRHVLELHPSPAEHAWAETFIAQHDLADRPRLGLHVGSGGTKNLALKRWPLAQYGALLGQVRNAWPALAVLLFGGPEEEADLQTILAAHPSPRVIRVRSGNLRQAAALMQRCTGFLSVDTALMHVAAAMRTPGQIVIEAFTLNKTNEPYANPFVLVPNPAIAGRNLEFYRYDGQGIKGSCDDLIRGMAAVSVDSVFVALAKVFGRIPA